MSENKNNYTIVTPIPKDMENEFKRVLMDQGVKNKGTRYLASEVVRAFIKKMNDSPEETLKFIEA